MAFLGFSSHTLSILRSVGYTLDDGLIQYTWYDKKIL